MKYRNIKNGAVIDISCILTDVNWEALEPSKPQSDEDPQENEDSSIEEPKKTEEKSVEEPQAKAIKKPQKKTRKKG